MSITLPNASTANTESTTANTAAVTAAQNAFIANVTVLINNAVNNGLFFVEPFSIPLVTSDFVTTYFENLGYTVVFPFIPVGPFNTTIEVVIPQVLPPGYQTPLGNQNKGSGPPRYNISWNS